MGMDVVIYECFLIHMVTLYMYKGITVLAGFSGLFIFTKCSKDNVKFLMSR